MARRTPRSGPRKPARGKPPPPPVGGPRRPPRGRSPAAQAGRPTAATALYGLNPVEAALEVRRRPLHALHLKGAPHSARLTALRERAEALGVPVTLHGPAELDALAPGAHHQGAVLQCGPLPVLDDHAALALGRWRADASGDAPPPLLLALDQVEDPRNLGAVARAALAFAAAGLVVPRDHSAPFSAAASSASAGALERLPVYVVPNLARFLGQAKDHGFWVVGTGAEAGEPVGAYTHDRPLVLVLGNEGRGLRPLVARTCDQHLTIPLPGWPAGGSLNVASAAAVLLYHLMTVR